MSAPNKNYDPVEVTTLSADAVERAASEALAAIAAAANLDELKQAQRLTPLVSVQNRFNLQDRHSDDGLSSKRYGQ